MEKKYYIILDKYSQIPGYPIGIVKQNPGHPIFLDYEYDRALYKCGDDTFFSCKGENIELYLKHTKITFDYYPVRATKDISEFFISEKFLNILNQCKTPPFQVKPVKFFTKNKKIVSEVNYYIVSFYNLPKYIDYEKCLYVIPDGYEIFERNLIQIDIHYNILEEYDILPAILPTFPNALVISDRIKNNILFKEMQFQYWSLSDSPIIKFKKEMEDEGNLIDIDSLQRYSEKELNEI